MNFGHLPLPILIPIMLVGFVLCCYYAVEFRKGPRKHLFVPTIFFGVCCITVIISKLLDHLLNNPYVNLIFVIISVIVSILTILSVVVMSIKQYRKG